MAEADVRNFTINFGPQHPAAHGVLRLVLELDGEVVERVDPHIGLLHRGTEKLIEDKTYLQAMPYFDRLDYVAPMNQEHAFCLAIEKLLGHRGAAPRPADPRALFARSAASSRISSTSRRRRMDVGALTPPLWGFEEREKLMVFYERASRRAHARGLFPARRRAPGPAAEADRRHRAPSATRSSRWSTTSTACSPTTASSSSATSTSASSSLEDAWAWGFSGVMVRGSGAAWDLRKSQPYECYAELDFDIPIGKNGDCYDRYLIRMEEMRQSAAIMQQCIEQLLAQGRPGRSRPSTARSCRRSAPR